MRRGVGFCGGFGGVELTVVAVGRRVGMAFVASLSSSLVMKGSDLTGPMRPNQPKQVTSHRNISIFARTILYKISYKA